MSTPRLFCTLLISCLIFMLGGCAHMPNLTRSKVAIQEGAPSREQINKLNNLIDWRAEGRLAANHKTESLHASFIWEQQGPLYKIRFFGPLGVSGGLLAGNLKTNEVYFQNTHGKRLHSDSPEKLLYQATGLYFPVSNLSYWIKGLPHPGSAPQTSFYNVEGLPVEFRQEDWDIQYVNYISHFNDKALVLPGYLKIKGKNSTLKLAINSWS